MRKELRFSGSGGQGVITAAIIFAEAAVAEGKEAVQSQSYGPEARGGASKAEVIIDDKTIYHPHVETPDLVLAMTQKAADKYYKDLNPDGLLVLDEELVPNPSRTSSACRSRSSRLKKSASRSSRTSSPSAPSPTSRASSPSTRSKTPSPTASRPTPSSRT